MTVLLYSYPVPCMSQVELLKNPGFEHFNMQYSRMFIGNAGKSGQLVESYDTLIMPGSIDRSLASVLVPFWNYRDTSYHIPEAFSSDPFFYSNTGKANSGKGFSVICPMRLSQHENSIINAVGSLKEPLKEGEEYKVSLYIRPYSNTYFTKSICVYFPKDKIPYEIGIDATSNVPKYKSQLEPKWCISSASQKSDYTKVEFSFIAEGGEVYIYIGNLEYTNNGYWDKKEWSNNFWKANAPINVNSRYHKMFYCQYAIDDVSVSQVFDNEMFDLNNDSAGIENIHRDSILLGRLYFDTDNYTDPAQDVLMMLEDVDIDDPNLSIAFVGHADSEGSDSYNQKLSILRATKIAELVKKNLSSGKFLIIGKGSKAPVSETDPAKNRCVEIILITN